MIKRHRAHDIRTTGKRNDADTIVRPALDKLARDFANRIYARRFLAADCKIFGQHRAGDIQHEHDVDTAGFDLREAFAELRTRKTNHEESQG